MSLCPHGYTAFWDCPTCPPPMGEGSSHECPRCGKPTRGAFSEGGLRWAICDECMDRERNTETAAGDVTPRGAALGSAVTTVAGSTPALRIANESVAWERFNDHVRTCKGCKDFEAHGWLCNEGEALSDEWKALRQ